MVQTLDLDWFAFDLGAGQHLVLDVDWGEGGLGRAEAVLEVYDESGSVVEQTLVDGAGWSGGTLSFVDDVVWLEVDGETDFHAEFTWSADGVGGLGLEETSIPVAAAAAAAAEVGVGEDSDSAGADILYGTGIAMGDVLIGGEGSDVYRVTGQNEGETVTILGFHSGEGGDVLDISDLLASAKGALDVSYDSSTESTTLTVAGSEAGNTIIVVYGVDLTSDFDAYVVTDTII